MRSAATPTVFAAALLFACLAAVPASSQERTGVMPGFTMAPSAKILLLRPDIRVGEQSTGAMFEPNADWTDLARANIAAALARHEAQFGNEVVTAAEPAGDDAQKLADYQALFTVMAKAVLQYQFFKGNRLPTKKRDGVFEWSIGDAIKDLPGVAGADYVLFIFSEDQYSSTGRKVAQIAAAFAGVSITTGVHIGYAGLIDAKTGDLVWLNADARMGGDVRQADGALRRVAQLLEGIPVRVVPGKAAGARE